MSFATETSVPVERSQNEIRKTLSKYGATGFMFGESRGSAVVAFEMNSLRIKFVLPVPENPTNKKELQLERTRWRCLLLAIKAKLECAASGISTFEKEFLAHIVLPDGSVVSDKLVPQIQSTYQTGKMPPLLGPGVHKS